MIKILVPEGTGMHVPIYVEIDTSHGAAVVMTSNTLGFSYDPPYLNYITPNTPNANGDTISIYGTNFGSTRDHADEVKVWIGGLPCTAVSLTDDDTTSAQHIWQKGANDETAYLWCTSARLRVGPQSGPWVERTATSRQDSISRSPLSNSYLHHSPTFCPFLPLPTTRARAHFPNLTLSHRERRASKRELVS